VGDGHEVADGVEAATRIPLRAAVGGLAVVPESRDARDVPSAGAGPAHGDLDFQCRDHRKVHRSGGKDEGDCPEDGVVEAAAAAAHVVEPALPDLRAVSEDFGQQIEPQANVVAVLETDPDLDRALRDEAKDDPAFLA
jgi:hypothetical protein